MKHIERGFKPYTKGNRIYFGRGETGSFLLLKALEA